MTRRDHALCLRLPCQGGRQATILVGPNVDIRCRRASRCWLIRRQCRTHRTRTGYQRRPLSRRTQDHSGALGQLRPRSCPNPARLGGHGYRTVLSRRFARIRCRDWSRRVRRVHGLAGVCRSQAAATPVRRQSVCRWLRVIAIRPYWDGWMIEIMARR